MCLLAVKNNGWSLQFVVEIQTPEICLEAVKNFGFSVKFVKNQTPKICFEAVKQDINAYEHVKEKTLKIYFYFVIYKIIKKCADIIDKIILSIFFPLILQFMGFIIYMFFKLYETK
jgi:hypothetical protein